MMKKYSMITGDGTIYDIDNTDGVFESVEVISSVNNQNYRGYIYSSNESNKPDSLNKVSGEGVLFPVS